MSIVKNTQPFANERLFDYDPVTGTKTYFSSGGKYGTEWAFRTEFEDVSPEVDAAKVLKNDDDHWKKGVKNGFLHYAHIPDGILYIWHTMGVNINDPKALFEMCNKPEWSDIKLTRKVHE